MAVPYRYNVIIAIESDPSGVTKGNAQAKQQLREYEKEVRESARRRTRDEQGLANNLARIRNEETANNQRIASNRKEKAIASYKAQNEQQLQLERERINTQNNYRANESKAIAFEQYRQQQSIKQTQQVFADVAPFDKFTSHSKKTAIEHGKTIDAIIGKNKELEKFSIVGDKNSGSRNQALNYAVQQQLEFAKLLNQASPFSNNQNLSLNQANAMTRFQSPSQIVSQTRAQASYQESFRNRASANIDTNLERIDRVLANQNFDDSNRKLKQLTTTTKEGADALGTWGRAFKGAFIGAIAGMTFSTIIGGITSIVDGVKNLAIESVHLAGNLEATTNALAVVAGSSARAKEEIASIDEVARNTTGLRMEQAEVGYTRLRNLGFAAQEATGFVAGLAKQKLISGADEQSVDRAIVNLTQLRAGSSRASQDVREMLHSLPSLADAFQRAFGTTDNRKIGQMFNKAPEETLTKLSKAMAESANVAGGLNESWAKLGDMWMQLQRDFGEPLVEPVTEAIKDLTAYLTKNESVVRSWGQTLADVIRGVRDAKEEGDSSGGTANAGKVFSAGITALRVPTAYATFGLSEVGLSLLRDAEMKGRVGRESKALEDARMKEEFDQSLVGTNFNMGKGQDGKERFIQVQSVEHLHQLEKAFLAESELRKKWQRDAIMKQEETDRQLHQNAEIALKEDETRIKGKYAKEKALLDSHLRLTTQDEIKYTTQSGKIKASELTEQYSSKKKNLETLLELEKGNLKDETKIKSDLAVLTQEYNANLIVNDIETKTKLAELRRKEKEQERQDLIEANSLLSQEWKQSLDSRTFQLEQQIDKSATVNEEGFRALINTTNSAYDELIQINRDALDLQLQNDILTDQQRANLKKKSALDEIQLTEDKSRRVTEIEKNEHQRRIDLITQQGTRNIELLQAGSQGKGFEGLFAGSSFSRSGASDIISRLREGVISGKDSAQNEVERLRIELRDIGEKIDPFTQGTEVIPLDLQNKQTELINSLNFNRQEVEIYKQKYVVLSKIEELNKARNKSQEEYQGQILADRHGDELNQLNAELDYKRQLFVLETNAKYKDTAKILQYQHEVKLLEEKRGFLLINQEIEDEAYRKSTRAGLRETFEQIRRGETRADIYESSEKALLEERNATLTESIRIEQTLTDATLLGLTRQIEGQKTVNELNQKELDAIIRIDRAKAQIGDNSRYSANQADAKLYEFFANQEGVTGIVADAKINLVTDAYKGLDAVIGKLTQSLGFASDATQQLLSSLIKLALNKVFMKIFGIDINGNSVNSIRANGASATGGAGGSYGVGNIIQQALNSGGGGSSASSLPPTLGGNSFSSLSTPNITPNGALPPTLGDGNLWKTLSTPNTRPTLLEKGAPVSSMAGTFASSLAMTALPAVAIALFMSSLKETSLLKGALKGGLVGFIASIFNRNSLRRKEETVRDKAMVDAFRQMDDLIEKVRYDRIDGESALTQAEQIRANYVDQMGQLTDKKTRNIALADVSRIDAKIATLKTAVTEQTTRKQRLEDLVPTFADGGATSGWMKDNYRINPLGYQTGRGTGTSDSMFGYFPSSDKYARFSNTEYIFDAQTTKNVGVADLEMIRQTKGRSYNDLKKRVSLPFATGGALLPSPLARPNAVNTVQNAETTAPMNIQMNIELSLAIEQFVKVVATYIGADGAEQIANVLANLNNTQGQNALLQSISKNTK